MTKQWQLWIIFMQKKRFSKLTKICFALIQVDMGPYSHLPCYLFSWNEQAKTYNWSGKPGRFYMWYKWQEGKWSGLSGAHMLVGHSVLFLIPKYHIWVSMNTLKSSEMLKTFPNSQFFSFSGILVIWKPTRWAAAALQQF